MQKKKIISLFLPLFLISSNANVSATIYENLNENECKNLIYVSEKFD